MADRVIFARALPEAVRITETYSYHQEVSRNSSYGRLTAPQGHLAVSVAYDGQSSFSQRAYQDVRQQLGSQRRDYETVDALIGHLAFANFHRTGLSEALDLRGNFNTVPIVVPVHGSPLTQRHQLVDDRHAWVADVNYAVDEPRGRPIGVEFMVHDEDTLGRNAGPDASQMESIALDDIVRTVTQHLNARQDLSLQMLVRLNLPIRPSEVDVQPIVRRVSLHWPRITSPLAFHLAIGDAPTQAATIRFNPLVKGLEWCDVVMASDSAWGEAGLRSFASPQMVLTIEQPGELYPESQTEAQDEEGVFGGETLMGEVEVEIPGYLLSGMEARLYDGTGRLVDGPPLHRLTRLVVQFRLILDDIFSRRILSPRQHLHFDQVIPHEMRVLDVLTALADRGFRIIEKLPKEPNETTLVHFIKAKRPTGSDTLMLWLVMDGKRSTTRRETQIPGGQRYTSIFESGELIVHMVGQLPGKSRVLTEEMNALQQALRERFDRLRSRR